MGLWGHQALSMPGILVAAAVDTVTASAQATIVAAVGDYSVF
jgi:hypothetical protein